VDHPKSGIDCYVGILKMPWKALTGWIVVISLLGVTFVLGAIFYVWLYMQQVRNGYRLAKLYEEHESLLAIERKLKLEWCRFQDPNQLEELGRARFKLAPPRQDQKILVR
jgi:hypothetical protein